MVYQRFYNMSAIARKGKIKDYGIKQRETR